MDGPRPRLPNPRSHLTAVTLLACAVAVGGWYGVRTYTAQVNAQGGFCCMQAGQACAASTLGVCVAAGRPWARTRDACDYELCNVKGWCCDPDAANNCPANADTTRAGCGAGKTFFTDRAACQTAAALPVADRCENLGYCCSALNINNPAQNCKEPLVESADCGGGATWYASKATCDLMNNPADVRNFCNDTEGICCYPRGTTDDTFGGALAEAVCWGDEPGEEDLNRRSDCLRLGGTWAGQLNVANADGCVDQLLPQNCGTPRNYCVYHKNEAGALVVGCKNAAFNGFNPPFNPPPAANAAAAEGQRLRGTADAGYATADACTAACRVPVVAEAACCDPTKPQGQRCAATGVFGNNPCMQCQTKGDAAGCNAVAGGVCAWRDGFCEADVAKCSTFCCDANARQCRRVPAGTAGCADLGTPYVGDPKPQNDCQAACGGVAQQAACPQGQRQLASMALCDAQCGVQIGGGGQNAGQQGGGLLGGRQAGGIGGGRQGGQGQVAGRQGGQGGVGQLSGNTQGNIGTLAGVNGATSSAGTSAGGTSSLASSRAPSTTSRTSSTSSRTSSTSPRTSLTSSRTSATTSRTSSTSSRTSSTTSRASSTTSRTSSAGGGTGGTTSRTSSGGGGGIGRTTSIGGRTSSTTSRTSSTTSRTSSTTSRTTSRTTSTTSRTTSRTSSTTSRTSTSVTTSRTSSTTSRTSATTSRTFTSATTSRTSATTSRASTSATTSRTSATTSRASTSVTTSRTSTSATTSRTSSTTSRTSSTTSRTTSAATTSRTSSTTSRTSSTTSRTSTSSTTSRTSETTSRTSATTSRSSTSATTSRTSATTSRTSATTSRTSTSATTSRSVPLDMCTGTECADFGGAFCDNLGLVCQPTDSMPCFACTGGSSTSSRTSAATTAGTSRATSTSRTSVTTSRATSRPTTSRTSATTSRTTSAPGTTSRTTSSRITTSRTSSSRTTSRTSLRMSSAPVPRCGNDIREPGEQCGEPGLSCLSGQYCEPTTCRCNQSSSTTSRTSTSYSAPRSTPSLPSCGNGVREAGEQCGEPGLRCPAGSRCDARVCLCDLDVPRPFCGDGRINPTEQCGEPGLSCPAGQDCESSFCACSGAAACGDGRADPGEQCNEPGLRCGPQTHCEKRSCLCMPFIAKGRCGDGTLHEGEECDDGNARNFDGCSAFCEYERGVCGDGVLQRSLGEQCEPSLHDPLLPFRCAANCRIQNDFCGNGSQDPGEECDDGVNNSNIQNVRCRLDCSLARCGDGILDSVSEECDDGNRLWGDGCDRFCKREVDLLGRSDDRWANGIALPASLVELPFLGVRGASRLAVIPGIVDLVMPAAHPSQTPETGPGAVAVAAAGAAAGLAWMRRRRP